MKKLLTLIMTLVMALTITITTGSAVAAGIEYFDFGGETFRKAVNMPVYLVPHCVARIDSTIFIEQKLDNGVTENFFHPRTLMSVRMYEDPDYPGSSRSTTKLLLGNGDIILNDDVPVVYLNKVWVDNLCPLPTLAMYDGENYWIPLGITTWKELFNNSTGWPDGVTESTFVLKDDPNGIEELRDPERDPFLSPRLAWSKIFVTIDQEFGQKTKYVTYEPELLTDSMCIQGFSFKRKLWLVAQRQPDYSYKYFFLKKYSKNGPLDLSKSNDLGSVEAAVAYLKGK